MKNHFCTKDKYFMQVALDLAAQGLGRTSPNPVVGAVVVREGQIVGRGYHALAGTPHAEVHALREAGEQACGAALYVTLEPCNHHGRTPPCTEAIIAAGIAEVFVALEDPNPLVAGSGCRRLREAGITVAVGLFEEKARALNEIFIKYITTGLPFIHMKWAMTLDGKIAAASGQEKAITGDESRLLVHCLRDRYDAIMVGIGTILADDPVLTTRLPAGNLRNPAPDYNYPGFSSPQNPVRVVVDSKLRLPPEARVIESKTAPLLVATTEQAPAEKITAFTARGVEVLIIAGGPPVHLEALLRELAQREISSILLEGGAILNAAFLEAGLVDKITCFIAPQIIGGHTAPGPVAGPGRSLDLPVKLRQIQYGRVGEDIFIEGYPEYSGITNGSTRLTPF